VIHSARPVRSGASLLEVLIVMAIIVAFGAIALPQLRDFNGDSRIKAAADTVKGRIANARAASLESGRPYRLALNPEGNRFRIAPDELAFQNVAANDEDEEADSILVGETNLPKDVTAEIVTADGSTGAVDDNGWTRVATFRPDGTCREDSVTIRLTEPGTLPILIQIRGLTGAATIEKTKPTMGTTP